jgi:hypothetical protein
MAKREIQTTIRIIDHKKVLITDDEYSFYDEICKGYDKPNFKGSDLFQDHFEVNDEGIIIFVKPPHKKYSSMEVFTFLISIMVNQQLRISQNQIKSLISEASLKYQEQLKEIDVLKKSLEEQLQNINKPLDGYHPEKDDE